MSIVVIPSATIPTTVATGTRKPRMQGTPPICFGSTLIRVNFMSISRLDPASVPSGRPTASVAHVGRIQKQADSGEAELSAKVSAGKRHRRDF
jgi:hypothetical protein